LGVFREAEGTGCAHPEVGAVLGSRMERRPYGYSRFKSLARATAWARLRTSSLP
jgi:hypothetical protein